MLLAFNQWIRAIFPLNSVVYSPVVYIATLLLVKVPRPNYSIYMLWLRITDFSRSWSRTVDNTAEAMRARVMREEWERKRLKEQAERDVKARKRAKLEKKELNSNDASNGTGDNTSWHTSISWFGKRDKAHHTRDFP